MDDWWRRRNDEVARRLDPKTDAAQRRNWNASTRTGDNLVARTPSELRALPTTPTPSLRTAVRDGRTTSGGGVVPRLRASARGATDAVLVGHGAEAEAAFNTIPAIFSGDALGPQYQASLQRARAQDQYDRTYYPLSRDVGEVLGTGAALFATDGLAAAAAPRFAARAYSAARAMPAMTRMERGSVALGGAGFGLAGQGLSDLLYGHSPDWRDYVASGLGGAAMTSSVARVGPTVSAAAGAGVRSAAEAALNKRAPDVDQMSADMVGAGYLAGLMGLPGEQGSNRLDWRVKGRLGERLSDVKSVAQGNPPTRWQFRQPLANGQTTVVDSGLARGPQDFVESKFGPTAKLTGPQRAAHAQFPGRYRDDYWMPSHVGQIVGSVSGAFGVPMLDQPTNGADAGPPTAWPN